MDSTLLPKIKVEVIVSKISVDAVVDAAKKALYTGHIGDGKIFVYNVTRVVKIRTGEENYAALQELEYPSTKFSAVPAAAAVRLLRHSPRRPA